MSTVTPPSPPRPDDLHDVEALEALIEEARRRARRRRRGYAGAALVAVAAGLIGFSVSSDGGDPTGAADRAEPRPVSAQVTDGNWRPASGLEGGLITALAVDPRHPETVFAATLEAGVFRSADGARNWRQVDLGPAVSRADAIAIAPGDPRTIYAGTERGVLKSTDGGRTWRRMSSDLLARETAERREHRAIEGFVYALAVDGRDADVVYAGTADKGVLKTTNGGRSWRRLDLDAGPVIALALGPQGSVLYAGGHRGIDKSTDGGATWRRAGLRGRNVMTLAVDPGHPNTVFAGTLKKGIFKTTDGGASWRNAGLAGIASSSLALDPANAGIAYVGTWEKGTFRTDDGGRSWRRLDAGGSSSALALDPRDPATIYAGARRGQAGGGVVKSRDGGRTWRPMDVGLNAARVSAISVDRGRPGTAYAAAGGRGVFRRVGGEWQPAGAGLDSSWVRAVAVEPRAPAGIYAATDAGVFKSTDGGASWFGSRSVTGAPVKALAVDPRRPATVYALQVEEEISRDDGGPATFYGSRVYKTTDGGRVWSMGTSVLAVQGQADPGVTRLVGTAALVIDPQNPEVLYAGGPDLVKSVDGGEIWRRTRLAQGPVLSLALDPAQTSVVYAGTTAGLAKSTDAGASWQPLRGALDGRRVEAIALDPADRQTLFAGTDRGVFWSTDGGSGWRRFTDLPRRPFDALAVDRAAGVLYAGAYGGGIYELALGR